MSFFTNKISLLFVIMAAISSLVSCTKDDEYTKKVVVKVKDHELTAKDFADKIARRLKQFDALTAKDPGNVLRTKENVVSDFIIDSIIKIYANENGIKVEKVEIDAEVNSLREKYPDDLSLRRILSQEGISLEQWSNLIQIQILKRKVFDKLKEQIKAPTSQEIKDYYKEFKDEFTRPEAVKLRQIVLSKESDARRIKQELRRGKNFKELAKKYSIAPEAQNEGETDWIEKGTLEVFDRAFRMRTGARSDVLESPYGYHIYKVLKKQKAGKLSFKDSEDKIRALLVAKREKDIYTKWLEKQVRETRVFRDDKLIEAIQVQTRGS